MLSRRRSVSLIGAGGAMLSLIGCAAPTATSQRLVVYAAASLSGVFGDAGRAFEEQTGADVTFNFAGSSDLLAQLEQGATADVLATADERTMVAASDAGLLAASADVFARNSLVVALAPGNPAGIDSLDDLATGPLVVVCAPQVPCGAATREFASRAGLELHPVSEESSVTDVLAKVANGEADAGVVYRTDLLRESRVGRLEIPNDVNVTTSYPAAVLAGLGSPELAEEFVGFLHGRAGRQLLADAGFEVPS
jgi:molybdate transport system substrate-binding protein